MENHELGDIIEEDFRCWKCGSKAVIKKVVSIDEHGVIIAITCEGCFTDLIVIERRNGDRERLAVA